MDKMIFITIPELKTKLGVDKIEIVKSPKTDKLFAHCSAGNYKVEQAIDLKQPLRFMYETEDAFNEGCIISVPESANVLASL